ncbi:TPA: CDP-glycerol glycerophosphotransferase family protein [Proteus mirabilis]|nr:CDP-glycerol glycerophosphotransferase family protein [Proteus mirabilis]HEJ9421312.1 CDP-glycerol glycerophosphotransferase family protein [Proteus mirabilis]
MKNKILRALFALFIGYPLLYISSKFKRNPKRWVIGSQKNFFCNSKYFFLKNYKNQDNIELIWLTPSLKTKKSLRNKNIKKVYLNWEPKGIWYALTSYIFICSYTINDDLPYYLSKNAKIIYLWHGVGIKNIYLKSNNNLVKRKLNSKLAKFLYPPLLIRPDLFFSTSDLMTEHFSECFNLKKTSIAKSLYPRCSFMLNEKSIIKNFLFSFNYKTELNIIKKLEGFNKSYIYMPTWRNYNKNSFIDSGINLNKLNNLLAKKNEILFIKLHPQTMNYKEKIYSNILFLENNIDIYSILPFIDILITDYSSIYYDFILLKNKKIILYPYDLSDYMSINKDFAFDYDSYMPAVKAYSYLELENIINNKLYDNPDIDKKTELIRSKFWEQKDDITYHTIISRFLRRI